MADDTTIKKSYWSVTPAEVRYCKGLVDGAKLLYGEISALCNERGFCWAGNEYFSELYGNDARTIQRWIGALAKNDFIYVDLTTGRRKIFLAQKFNFGKVDVNRETTAEEIPDKKENKPKKQKDLKPVKPKYSDQDLFLAELLLSKILYNFPAFENRKVNISEWAEEVRKLREIDKATNDQINFMITWVHGGEINIPGKTRRSFEPNDFWSKNIMSAKKLRKQWFDNLVPQLQADLKKTVKKQAVAQL